MFERSNNPYIYIYIIIFFLIVRAQGRRPVRKWRRIIACRNVVYSQIQVSSVACFSRIEAGRIPSAIERCGGVGVCHGRPVPVGIAPHTLDLERHSASHYAEYITALKRRACPIKCRDVVFLRPARISHRGSFQGSFSIQRLRAEVRRMRFYGYVRTSTVCLNVTLLRRTIQQWWWFKGEERGNARMQGSLNLLWAAFQNFALFFTMARNVEGWSFEITGCVSLKILLLVLNWREAWIRIFTKWVFEYTILCFPLHGFHGSFFIHYAYTV